MLNFVMALEMKQPSFITPSNYGHTTTAKHRHDYSPPPPPHVSSILGSSSLMRSMDGSMPREATTGARRDNDDNLFSSRALAPLSSTLPLDQRLPRAATEREPAAPPHGLVSTMAGAGLKIDLSVGGREGYWCLAVVSLSMGRRREAAVCMAGAGRPSRVVSGSALQKQGNVSVGGKGEGETLEAFFVRIDLGRSAGRPGCAWD